MDNDRLIINGWLFSGSHIIKSLKLILLKGLDEEYIYNTDYPLPREDVYRVFGHNSARRSGFSADISCPVGKEVRIYFLIDFEDGRTEKIFIKSVSTEVSSSPGRDNYYYYDFEKNIDEGITKFKDDYSRLYKEKYISHESDAFPEPDYTVKIIAGIIVYKSDIELLLKNIKMFSRQSVFFGNRDFNLEIIILDNDDGRQISEIKEIFKEKFSADFYSKITFLSSENTGFGSGHNRIFYYAKDLGDFDYYLCINPDGIPHKDMLKELLSFALRNDDRGIYEARQFPVEHPKVYDMKTGKSAWVSGCCVMFPYKIFDELGGFDDFFFMYMEDVDISWRARLSGYGCYTVHNAYFSHFADEKERESSNMKKEMFASGYKLAAKYKSEKFKKFTFSELNTMMSFEEIEELEREVKEKEEFYSSFRIEDFMNFDTAFYFSQVRWK